MDRKAGLETIRERPANLRPDTMIPEIDSSKLLGANKSIAIRHGDQVYTLRLTRADKLLLTK